MSTRVSKRKAIESLEESTKRLRIEPPLSQTEETSSPLGEEEEEEEDECSEYNDEKDGFSSDDGEKGTETPVTPFSPTRKKFPSEYKTIQCTLPGCSKTFNRPARLKSHLVTHTNERPFPCPFDGCDKTYVEDKHLQHHIKGTHKQERKWVCDWEGCGKSFLTGTRLRRHEETHKGHDRFRCTDFPPCNMTFRKHQTLQRHIRSDHFELAPFPCSYVDPITKEQCNAGFDGAVGLRKHVEREHTEPQFVCTSCTVPSFFNQDGTPKLLAFKTNNQLQTHIRKEHAECMFCDKKCSSHRELEKHIESQHSGKSVEERKTVPCTHIGCGKSFTKKSNLEAHIRSAHNGERFICGTFDVSPNPALAAFDPDEHACGKDFTTNASLEAHIRTAHLGLPRTQRKKASAETDFIDDDKSAPAKKRKAPRKKQKPNIIDELLGASHDAAVPNRNRNIPCPDPICPHTFTRAHDLQLHMRTAHPRPICMPGDSDLALPVQSSGAIPPTTQTQNPIPLFFDHQPVLLLLPDARSLDVDTSTDWDFQREALEGGTFWVGADVDAEAGVMRDVDSWQVEEEEMRRLIDGDGF